MLDRANDIINPIQSDESKYTEWKARLLWTTTASNNQNNTNNLNYTY